MRPKLSVCIPTYNRASLLIGALNAIVPQIVEHQDRVELVISDNGSTDDTGGVIRDAQIACPIKYRRHQENKGPLYNIVNTVTDMAQGEYAWIIGDDDLVSQGAIAKILSVIDAHPRIDYIFLNHSYEKLSKRDHYINAAQEGELKRPSLDLCSYQGEGMVDRWEDISFYSTVPALFTSMISHVFKRDIFIERQGAIATLCPEEEQRFEYLFPHLYLLMPVVVGRPAYYIGRPYIILFLGAQDWLGYWPRFLFTYVLQIPYRMEALGASKAAADHYRKVLFRGGVWFFRQVMFRPRPRYRCELGDLKISKQDDWVLHQGIKEYWKYGEFRRMLLLAFGQELIYVVLLSFLIGVIIHQWRLLI